MRKVLQNLSKEIQHYTKHLLINTKTHIVAKPNSNITIIVTYFIFSHIPCNREYNLYQQGGYLQHMGQVYMYYQHLYISVLRYYLPSLKSINMRKLFLNLQILTKIIHFDKSETILDTAYISREIKYHIWQTLTSYY